MRRERDAMRHERDAALRQIREMEQTELQEISDLRARVRATADERDAALRQAAELQRLNDSILQQAAAATPARGGARGPRAAALPSSPPVEATDSPDRRQKSPGVGRAGGWGGAVLAVRAGGGGGMAEGVPPQPRLAFAQHHAKVRLSEGGASPLLRSFLHFFSLRFSRFFGVFGQIHNTQSILFLLHVFRVDTILFLLFPRFQKHWSAEPKRHALLCG